MIDGHCPFGHALLDQPTGETLTAVCHKREMICFCCCVFVGREAVEAGKQLLAWLQLVRTPTKYEKQEK